jgi:hypothetical protein
VRLHSTVSALSPFLVVAFTTGHHLHVSNVLLSTTSKVGTVCKASSRAQTHQVVLQQAGNQICKTLDLQTHSPTEHMCDPVPWDKSFCQTAHSWVQTPMLHLHDCTAQPLDRSRQHTHTITDCIAQCNGLVTKHKVRQCAANPRLVMAWLPTVLQKQLHSLFEWPVAQNCCHVPA